MKKYKVTIQVDEIQFWEVEASSEEDAVENYMEGEHISTKPKQDEVLLVKEIDNENYIGE